MKASTRRMVAWMKRVNGHGIRTRPERAAELRAFRAGPKVVYAELKDMMAGRR